MRTQIALILFILISCSTHSLRYFYTATTGIPTFPEFVTVGLVDGEPISYYDSNIRREVPRQEWMAEEADYWEEQTQASISSEQNFKANIGILKSRFNQTGGVHIVQFMYGCEWDDETGNREGFEQYAYDGEDLLSFDRNDMRWITPSPQGALTKSKWDSDRGLNEYTKNYLTQECIDWLKKYVGYGRSSLERKVPPEVSVFQKGSSPVTCHATGFFPSGIVMSWQKNGEDLHEDVELGETLPNDDRTFQKTSRLGVKPEGWKKNTYTCIVQHSGLEEDVKRVFTDNSGPPLGIIIGCVVAVLLLGAVIGGIVWKKKKDGGYGKTNTSDTDSENSGNTAQKA
ncbi:class I histocompatibility antigen, F10 alpha chain-like [Megalops cyprinoides]|uniref:class I histocompatibility antigen, F10 alpha chain-like n=1 Tax=Megalops cyprinoides TaxID=118141 RepID=UPI001864F64E|nr:class I histocompatibility antigen, F10 alpha chain-like [Megalops cyprinoides]